MNKLLEIHGQKIESRWVGKASEAVKKVKKSTNNFDFKACETLCVGVVGVGWGGDYYLRACWIDNF